jgi:outer membrane protein assembly factor BamA
LLRSLPRPLCLLRLVALVLVVACGKQPPPDTTRATVRRIAFRGNGDGQAGSKWTLLRSASDFSLRAAMDQEQNPPLVNLIKPRVRRVFLDRQTLELDAWRIETWYAHHGYFDARVLGWDVRRLRKERHRLGFHRPETVRIVGQVKQGQPSVVDRITWEGFEALGGPMIAYLRQNAAIAEGQRFEIDSLRETEGLALQRLQEQGYAYARLETEVEVDAESHTVSIRLVADPGPVCTFGDVQVSGELPVLRRYVDDEVRIETGDRYRLSELGRTQRRLFGLGVFSVVNVRPDLSDPARTEVPLRVELAPSKSRQLRVGGGFALEPGKQDLHVTTDFRHANLWRRLVRLEVGTSVGYTTISQVTEVLSEDTTLTDVVSTGAPTLLVQAGLTIPRVPTRGWEIYQDVSYEQGIEPGYRFRTPTLSPGIRGRLSQRLTFELAYHFRYFDYLDLSLSGSDLRRTPLFLDFSDPYTLSFLRQQLTLDRRDDPLFPRKGTLSTLGLREAGGLLGGQYTYLRVETDQRLFVPIRRIGRWRPRGTVAMRIGGGFIQPYGADEEKAVVPFAERLFLGGSNSVRGWPRRQLGPYLYACGQSGEDYCQSRSGLVQPEGDIVPIGGLLALYSSIETRTFVYDDLGVALFVDAGMTWNDVEDIEDSPPQPTAGAGLRYRTPIGPLRFDVGYRLLNPPEYSQVSRIGVHFSLSEAF